MHGTGLKTKTLMPDAINCFLDCLPVVVPMLLQADMLACVSIPVLQGAALPLLILSSGFKTLKGSPALKQTSQDWPRSFIMLLFTTSSALYLMRQHSISTLHVQGLRSCCARCVAAFVLTIDPFSYY